MSDGWNGCDKVGSRQESHPMLPMRQNVFECVGGTLAFKSTAKKKEERNQRKTAPRALSRSDTLALSEHHQSAVDDKRDQGCVWMQPVMEERCCIVFVVASLVYT